MRAGEKLIDQLDSVEDTKGNNGERGILCHCIFLGVFQIKLSVKSRDGWISALLYGSGCISTIRQNLPHAGSDFYTLPMQPVDCLTDVELAVCALLEPYMYTVSDQPISDPDFIFSWSVGYAG